MPRIFPTICRDANLQDNMDNDRYYNVRRNKVLKGA